MGGGSARWVRRRPRPAPSLRAQLRSARRPHLSLSKLREAPVGVDMGVEPGLAHVDADGVLGAPTQDSPDRAGTLDNTGCADASPLSARRLLAWLPK